VCAFFKPRYKHTKLFTAEIIFPDESDACGMHKGYLRFDRVKVSYLLFNLLWGWAWVLALGSAYKFPWDGNRQQIVRPLVLANVNWLLFVLLLPLIPGPGVLLK